MDNQELILNRVQSGIITNEQGVRVIVFGGQIVCGLTSVNANHNQIKSVLPSLIMRESTDRTLYPGKDLGTEKDLRSSKGNVLDFTTTHLVFQDVDSVDVVIDHLNNIKKDLKEAASRKLTISDAKYIDIDEFNCLVRDVYQKPFRLSYVFQRHNINELKFVVNNNNTISVFDESLFSNKIDMPLNEWRSHIPNRPMTVNNWEKMPPNIVDVLINLTHNGYFKPGHYVIQY